MFVSRITVEQQLRDRKEPAQYSSTQYRSIIDWAVFIKPFSNQEWNLFSRRADAAFIIAPRFAYSMPFDLLTDSCSGLQRLQYMSSLVHGAPKPFRQAASSLVKAISQSRSAVELSELVSRTGSLDPSDLSTLIDFVT